MKAMIASVSVSLLLVACGKEKKPESVNVAGAPQTEDSSPAAATPSPNPQESVSPVSETKIETPFEAPDISAELQPVVDAAYQGPELVGVELYEEKWNIKPARIENADGGLRVSGRISHHIPFAPGDQVDYNFLIGENGEILENGIQIQAGGFSNIVGPILRLVDDFNLAPIPADLIADLIERLEDSIQDDSWEVQSQKMAMIISLHIYAQERLADSSEEK